MVKKYLMMMGVIFSHFLNAAPAIQEEHPVVILGGGVAALTSAIYLGRAGVTPVVVTGPVVGGAITQSPSVQNWPGELDITGVDLSEKIKLQAIQNGAILRAETVVKVDFSASPFVITTEEVNGEEKKIKTIKAQACIIALGARPKLLGIPGESGADGYWLRGVYSCAVCDGGLYKNKVVAVVGGGDSALTEAQYLSLIAKKVYIIMRGDHFRSVEGKRLEDVLSCPNIEVISQTEIDAIKGDGDKLTYLVIRHNQTQHIKSLNVDALFLAIGAEPNTGLFKNQLELDKKGFIVLKQHRETSIPGVYAIGDIADAEGFQQAIIAAGSGAEAALQAHKYLTSAPKQILASRFSNHVRKEAEPLPRKHVDVLSDPHAVAQVFEIRSQQELKALLASSPQGVILDFYGDYCPPCRSFAPLYQMWANKWGDKMTFLKINVKEGEELFNLYGVRVIPTLVILDKEGKIVQRGSGSLEIARVGQYLEREL